MALRARGCRAERRRWARATPRSPRDCEPARRDPPRDRLVWWTDSKSGGARLTHELQTPPGSPHPLFAAGLVIEAIRDRREELAKTSTSGSAPKRLSSAGCTAATSTTGIPRRVGSSRWAPGNRLEDVDAEFRALLASIAAETGCDIDLDLRLVRDTYRIDPAHPLVLALRNGYRDVTGAELGLVGMKVVAGGAIFHQAGTPTVYQGPVGTGAHADVESITVTELVRATRVYLRTLAHLWA